MAPESVGAATARDAGSDPLNCDYAGGQIVNFNTTIGEWIPLGKVAAAIVERQAYHLSRRVGVKPEMALTLTS